MSFREIENPQDKRNESTSSWTLCSRTIPVGKIVIITAIALVALGLIAIGTLSLLNTHQLLGQSFRCFSVFSPLVTGVFMGTGGGLLGGLALYQLLSRFSSPAPIKEKKEDVVLPPPANPIVRIEPPQPLPILPPPVEVTKPRISLIHAMRLFKNYTPHLAAKWATDSTLSTFLQKIEATYPEGHPAKGKIQSLIEIQKILEDEFGNLDSAIALYETWCKNPVEPFSFFAVVSKEAQKDYILIQFQADTAPSSEQLKTYLLALQQHFQGGPTPELLCALPLSTDEKAVLLSHNFHRFLKTSETALDQACKKIYKIGLLKQVLSDYPEWKEDDDFRAWVASSILHLKKGLESIPVPQASLRKEWENALGYLNIIEQELNALLPLSHKAPSYEAPFPPLKAEKVTMTPSLEYPGTEKVKSEVARSETQKEGLQPPSSYPNFQAKEDLVLLQTWHNYFLDSYKQEELNPESLEAEVSQFLLHLPKTSAANVLTHLSNEEKETILTQLYDIATLGLTLHVASQRTVFHPSRLLAFLKTLDFFVSIVQMIDTTYFTGLTFDTTHFHEVLLDPYFDLGSYQATISQTLDSIAQKGGELDLITLTGHRSEFWMKKFHFKGKDASRLYVPNADIEKYQNDFEGKEIPLPLARLRTLCIFVEGFVHPHTTLDYRGKFFKNREDFKDHMDGLKRAFNVGAESLLKKRVLLTLDSEKTITPLKIKFKSESERDYQDRHAFLNTLGAPASPYYLVGGPVKQMEIRTRLAEGMVANITVSHVDQDGNFGCEVKSTHNDRGYQNSIHGLKQAQLKIHQDMFTFPHLSIEASRDLQLMASGRDNRASNVLYTFNKHTYVFQQQDYGEDYKHVFRLLLFRSDLLMRELELNPAMVDNVLSNFDEMLARVEKTNDFETWAFLYKAHADVLKILRSSSIVHKREEPHTVYTQKLLGWIKEIEKGEGPFEARTALHMAYLYSKATLGFVEKEVVEIGKSLILAQTQIEHLLVNAPLEGQTLYDLRKSIVPSLIEKIEKEGMHHLDQLVAYLLKQEGEKRIWEKVSHGVYKTDALLLDLHNFQVIQGGCKEGLLPKEIREDESFKALFGESLLKQIHTFTYVSTPLGKAWHIPLKKGNTQYSIYLRQGDPRFPLLFRQREGKNWEQRRCVFTSSETLPVDFQKGFLWSQGGMATLEDPQGRALYTPHFEGERLVQMERHVNGHPKLVLNSADHALFSRLDDAEGFVITESEDKMPLVTYLRGNAQYIWNKDEGKWESVLYKGYFLSPKSLEEWVPVGTQVRKTPFFSSLYKNYHLLENKEGKGKLILPHRPFQNVSSQKDVTTQEMKYSHTLTLTPNASSPWEKHTFAAFELEANGYLKSKRPQDFLYLSYALFVQGKYGEAMLYLDRSQAVWTVTDPEILAFRDQVKEWFLQWKDPSPNGIACKTKLLFKEHQLRQSTYPPKDQMLAYDREFLPALKVSFEAYLKQEALVDPLLRLNKLEIQEIQRLTEQATACNEKTLSERLTKEIEFLEKQISKQEEPSAAPPKYVPVPLFDVSPWLSSIKESETHKQTQEKVGNLVKELEDIFQGEALVDDIGKELAKDINRYAEKIEGSFTIAEGASLPDLLNKVLCPQENTLLQNENTLRQRILHQFLPLKLSKKEASERALKEQEAIYDQLFEKARHCFGLDDFSSLIEMQAISAQQVDALKEAIREYEIARTDRRLVTRKKEAVQRLSKDPQNSILKEECAGLLQEWRQYDGHTHPYAHILLLLEDELNITARASQTKHIHKLLKHPDAYIHEAMAGGKTTFLRNLFSAIQSHEGRLAGVITYAPLMAMHHKEYAAVNHLALGSTAYPLYYNRNAPHDETALKLMIISHLKALNQHGRIDQTPQSSISLNHTLTELIRVLHHQDLKTLEELTPAINALQKLLRLRGEYLSVYSDEIDKIFDPMKDFNYSVGQATVLQEKYYQPALELIHVLMEEKPLKECIEAIKKNPLHLQQLSETTFEAFLRTLAEAAFMHFKLPFDKETTLDYLTEVHQRDIEHPERQEKIAHFYEETVLTYNDPAVILNMQMLHSFIGILFRDMKHKIVGTDFGRSKDGIFVKPFSFSAVCQESSQRSFVLSTVLETCFDYLISGIGNEATKAYVEKIKQAAAQEVGNAATLEETPAARLFKSRFNVALSEVKESDLSAIAKTMEKSFPLFSECLVEILLKNFTYYEEKIEGNAHHLPHLVGHFSGSSGSPERIKTLPGSIQKHEKLIRQSGAIGSVFYALLKGFEETDMVELVPSKPIEEQLGKLLKPGDTFVDNAPFFPGKKGLEIVEAVSKASPTLSSFRFLDEEDDVCIWDKHHARKGEEGVRLDEVVSVISHKGRQGTNWTFAKGTKGIVEVGVGTELTSFYQSLMRFRLLGKGQKAQVLYDTTLQQSWSTVEVLKGKSLLAKVIWSLAFNESQLVKKLHFQANRKQIVAIRTEAIDAIKLAVTDVKALATIKTLEEFKLVERSPLDPEQCGRPIQLGDPTQVLNRMVTIEKERLNQLKEKIKTLEIETSVKKDCDKILDEQLLLLDDPQKVMSSKDLPSYVPVNHSNHDTIEEIEIEIQGEGEQEQQVEQEVSFEVEMELTLQEEMRLDVEAYRPSDHPHSEEGREWGNYAMGVYGWWNDPFEKKGRDVIFENGYVDPLLFPNIRVSNYGLGLFQGLVSAKDPGGVQERQKQLWFYGEPKEKSYISSKVFIGIHKEGKITCQMGSVKDGDFFFYTPLNEQQIAHKWIDIPLAEALKKNRVEFCDAQLSAMDAAKDPRYGESYYNGKAKSCKELLDFQFIKIDLLDKTIPSSIPTPFRKKWVEQMALCKFLYVDAPFSRDEKDYLMQWLPTCGTSLDVLETRLSNYLKRFYPNSKNNELVAIIKQCREKKK